MVPFSNALSPYITWETVDKVRAKATMTYGGISGSGIFSFNEDGDFIRFSAMRYKGAEKASKLLEWVIKVKKYQHFDGIRVPSHLTATWKLDQGDWTWLELEVTELEYNLRKVKE